MFVDISDDFITISDFSSDLRADQISQLNFWGFAREPNTDSYKASPERIDALLPKLLKYFGHEKISYSLSPSCQDYLSKLNEQLAKYQGLKTLGESFKNGQINLERFRQFQSFIDECIARQLKDHQLKAAFHLYLVNNGANFSVPGSGKTAVVLSVYAKLKSENNANLLFVVGPPACFGPWRTEFRLTLAREPDHRILAGGELTERKSEYFSPPSKLAELYLTTYQTLLNDQDDVIAFLGQKGVKAFLVIDEAHYIKQISGNWAKAVLRISEYAKYRCVLTGTPFPKGYTDVYNLFDFLWPNNHPLDSETKIRIQIQEKDADTKSAKELLKEAIGPLFYRVRKSELGLTPPVFHPPLVLRMNQHERRIYCAIENKIKHYAKQDYLRNIEVVKILIRGRITRLRQCVSYARLLSSALEDYDESLLDDQSDLARVIRDYDALETPAKLEHLKELVDDLQKKGQKVVIWANFIGALRLIANHLNQAGLYCKLIYGETPIEQTFVEVEETRGKIRDEFVNPESGLDILVANPAACGESISLHKTCYHAIYYDLSYNCAQYLQSLDRIHRVGGSEVNQANYYFLQYENTIDQDIKANLDRKARKMYDIVEEDCSIYTLDMFEEDDDLEAYKRLFGEA